MKTKDNKKRSKLYNYLHKDIKEFNKLLLSFICIMILVLAGLLSYFVTNSYALFSDVIVGEKTIELEVSLPNATDKLMEKVGESGLEVVTHEKDETLQIGDAEDLTEYRYRGGDDVVTNNYIYFNCSDIDNQSADTCELYRIIGVFPTDDGEGNIENRIKIIKAESYGDNYWNSGGTNNWEEASLNTTFNETYYNSINEAYRMLIGDAQYYLGGFYISQAIYTNIMYQYERKIEGSDYYYDENPTNWTGMIALMYASDYGYGASSDCSTSIPLFDYDTNFCPSQNWLYLGSSEWLMTQNPTTPYSAFYVNSTGFVTDNYVDNYSYAVRPVLYLASDAEISDQGDGSSTNPYQLSSN